MSKTKNQKPEAAGRPWRIDRLNSSVRQKLAVLTLRGDLPLQPSAHVAEKKAALEQFKKTDKAYRAYKAACDRLADNATSLVMAREAFPALEEKLTAALTAGGSIPGAGATEAEVSLYELRKEIEFLEGRQVTLRNALDGLRRKAVISYQTFLSDRQSLEMNLAKPSLESVEAKIEATLNDAGLIEAYAVARRHYQDAGNSYPSSDDILGPVPSEHDGMTAMPRTERIVVDNRIPYGPIMPPEPGDYVPVPGADRHPRPGDFKMIPLVTGSIHDQ